MELGLSWTRTSRVPLFLSDMIQFSKNVSKVNFQSTEMIVSSNNAHQ